MRSLRFWGALPFLLPQAIRVRRTAPRFAAADGPHQGSFGNGDELQLVALGDSIIAGVGAQTLENALVGQASKKLAEELGCKISWSADGRIGARSEDVLRRVRLRETAKGKQIIIVSVGVNDVTSLSTVPRWRRNLRRLLLTLREQSPDALIALAGFPPLEIFPLLPEPLRAVLGVRAKAFDAAAREEVARLARAIHVPVDFEPHPNAFAADGFHPSQESYLEFGQAVAERIVEQLASYNLPDSPNSSAARETA